ncbi:type I methionyl aminopeptidase [Rarobacter faecitabidus]|uniref:Methionine aminopeptidase n=1 Tax=Rarobacter faecitabidus TaxID=13243 RepID=A0A542ZXK5_RARFA|nr:type I methionyl aminopeptidase [Rarobacter faecitabidus]TQL65075.1 methionine aminopeptidase type I [Rarobacter faecitabidus]
MFGRSRIEYKTRAQLASMRQAGLVVDAALDEACAAATVGVTTARLDEVVRAAIEAAGARPAFLGYEGFPASACFSVNEEIIHGIPNDRPLQDGDVLSIDAGAIVDGWYSDCARTVIVGNPSADDTALVAVARDAMWNAIAQLGPGVRVGVVGEAVERTVAEQGAADGAEYGIVEEFVGHGVGSSLHQDPDIPNFATRRRGARLRPGTCVAIEPMITVGSAEIALCEDEWTVVTHSGRRAAHFEHTVAILDGGILVLTAKDGGAGELAKRGIRVAELAAP